MDVQATLEGAPNFRDLGGLAAADGRRIRSRQLFRSEGPRYLTARDAERLRAIGFAMICDLRSDRERVDAPNAWCAGTTAELLNLDVYADVRATGGAGWHALMQNPSAASAREAMLQNYRSKPAAMALQLREICDRIIDRKQVPLLIHCTVGKDRTGFAVAILLHALGIPKETIYADYMQTAHFLDDRFNESINQGFKKAFGAPAPDVILSVMNSIERSFLDTAFEAVVEDSGSLDGYVEQRIGLTPQRRDLLMDLLLE